MTEPFCNRYSLRLKWVNGIRCDPPLPAFEMHAGFWGQGAKTSAQSFGFDGNLMIWIASDTNAYHSNRFICWQQCSGFVELFFSVHLVIVRLCFSFFAFDTDKRLSFILTWCTVDMRAYCSTKRTQSAHQSIDVILFCMCYSFGLAPHFRHFCHFRPYIYIYFAIAWWIRCALVSLYFLFAPSLAKYMSNSFVCFMRFITVFVHSFWCCHFVIAVYFIIAIWLAFIGSFALLYS